MNSNPKLASKLVLKMTFSLTLILNTGCINSLSHPKREKFDFNEIQLKSHSLIKTNGFYIFTNSQKNTGTRPFQFFVFFTNNEVIFDRGLFFDSETDLMKSMVEEDVQKPRKRKNCFYGLYNINLDTIQFELIAPFGAANSYTRFLTNATIKKDTITVFEEKYYNRKKWVNTKVLKQYIFHPYQFTPKSPFE